jgi:hypothetical protein
MTKEYFEVSFTKNDTIKPESVKAGDIADVLKSIENIVVSQIYKKNPQLKKEPVILSLTNIRASSIDLQFHSPFPDVTLTAFEKLGQAIIKNDFSELPSASYEDFNTLVTFTRNQKCVAEFVHQNGRRNVIATITPDIRIVRPPALTGETTLYAKVVRTGGKEPKVELETVDGRTLFCDASIDITTKLGSKLYQTVGLVGKATWDIDLIYIEKFSIEEVLTYEEIPFNKAINELSEATKNYYSDIVDVDQYISKIRGTA